MPDDSDPRDPRQLPLPTGDVTFLLTDIEGSTALFRRLGDDGYGTALADHHRIIRDALSTHGGAEVKTEGDAFLAAFAHPEDAAAVLLSADRPAEALEAASEAVLAGRRSRSEGALVAALEALAAASAAVGDAARAAAATAEAAERAA